MSSTRTGGIPREIMFVKMIASSLTNEEMVRGEFVFINSVDLASALASELEGLGHIDENSYVIDQWGNRLRKTSNEIISLGEDGLNDTDDDIVLSYR